MPHIIIDGQKIETSDGKTVIQAAYENGLNIPHFCWHPELSVSGNCRMCLVEIGMPKRLADGTVDADEKGNPKINFFPKLQIACATVVTEGMHVRTKTEKVIQAQEAVMEFLLINHPLDCPICDEAGQCKLQEYAYKHSRGESRFEEMKNRNEKRQSWGPNVMYDAERCISCSRCIRFSKEVAGQDVLTFIQRGDHVTIKLFDGTQLDNDYSMNVIDICPVGALTSKDFRFKSRVWDMSFNDSICPGCARGCNMQIGVRNNEILRLEPKTNMHVNKHWMCDYGRLTQYPFINNNRITSPMIKQNGKTSEVSWEEARQKAADLLKNYKPDEIMVVGSAKASCEENYLLQKFAKNVLKTKNIDILHHIDEEFEDDFLKTRDKSPNTIGAREVGMISTGEGEKINNIAEKIQNGSIKALYVMLEDFSDHAHLFESFEELDLIIVHATNHNKLTEIADIVFAAATYAESEGTYVNINQRVQHFTPALVTAENMRYMGMKMSRLDKFGADNDRWTQHENRLVRPSWKTIQVIANLLDANWIYKNAESVFSEISQQIVSFNNMSYELLDQYQGLTLGRGDKPDKISYVYDSHEMKPN